MTRSNAPGEDRTHNLRISLADQALPYKYDALTDCATGAAFHVISISIPTLYSHHQIRYFMLKHYASSSFVEQFFDYWLFRLLLRFPNYQKHSCQGVLARCL
ncbi:hypothetical protein T01_3257 [Trichinella spiralis]|uniref:Uncharacterized protein n=1 Tax=Trichinella spiralis TaxID=6334 RepID=A0A0V1BUF3_TRISP|nr:hypothetical protein T01_3257 [Trichinella spiralis]